MPLRQKHETCDRNHFASAWIDDPCYPGALAALLGAGILPVPVSVDDDGLNVAVGRSRCSSAKLVYISPSSQDPLGVTMSLPRRLALLKWANHAKAWIIEDDWGCEYRYSGRPLAALQIRWSTSPILIVAMVIFHFCNSPAGVYLGLLLKRNLNAPARSLSFAFVPPLMDETCHDDY